MFLPGDLIFVRGTGFVQRGIRWASRGPGEEPTYAHHVAGFVTADEVVEAKSSVVRRSLPDCVGSQAYQVWRCLALTEQQREAIANYATGYVGHKYGYWKIAAHLGDALLSRLCGRNVYLTRRWASMDDYPICSWVWAYAYNAVGLSFGIEPGAAQPDDMHDWVRNSPDWTMVHEVEAR